MTPGWIGDVTESIAVFSCTKYWHNAAMQLVFLPARQGNVGSISLSVFCPRLQNNSRRLLNTFSLLAAPDCNCLYVSVSPSLSVSQFTCLPACLSACMSVCVPSCPSFCLSASMSVCLSVCLPACLSVCLPACLSACLHVCLCACMSACLPICLPACPPVYLSVCLSTCLSVCLPAFLPACLTFKWI